MEYTAVKFKAFEALLQRCFKIFTAYSISILSQADIRNAQNPHTLLPQILKQGLLRWLYFGSCHFNCSHLRPRLYYIFKTSICGRRSAPLRCIFGRLQSYATRPMLWLKTAIIRASYDGPLSKSVAGVLWIQTYTAAGGLANGGYGDELICVPAKNSRQTTVWV